MRIDDFADESLVSELGARWRGVSDQVMGGLSKTSLSHNVLDHRTCLRLTGAAYTKSALTHGYYVSLGV